MLAYFWNAASIKTHTRLCSEAEFTFHRLHTRSRNNYRGPLQATLEIVSRMFYFLKDSSTSEEYLRCVNGACYQASNKPAYNRSLLIYMLCSISLSYKLENWLLQMI